MTDVLRIGATVTTPLGLLGLIAALGYYFYSRHLKHEEKKLDALPPEERSRIADQRLSLYGIDGSNLTRDDKTRLILEEIEKRYRLARLCAIICAVVFVLCFALASFAFVYARRTEQEGEKNGTKPNASHRPAALVIDDVARVLPGVGATNRLRLSFDITVRNTGEAPAAITMATFLFDEILRGQQLPKEPQEVSGIYVVNIRSNETVSEGPVGRLQAHAAYLTVDGKDLRVSAPVSQTVPGNNVDRFRITLEFDEPDALRGPLATTKIRLLYNGRERALSKEIKLK